MLCAIHEHAQSKSRKTLEKTRSSGNAGDSREARRAKLLQKHAVYPLEIPLYLICNETLGPSIPRTKKLVRGTSEKVFTTVYKKLSYLGNLSELP